MKVEVKKIGTQYRIYANGKDTGKWASTMEKATKIAAKLGRAPTAERRVPKVVESPKPKAKHSKAPRSTSTLTLVGGGVITGSTLRPFVVVTVAPGKNRAFYMSSGTGGETAAGEWNLFGGISSGGPVLLTGGKLAIASPNWFIKPGEGKRVAKYQHISDQLAKNLPEDRRKVGPYLASLLGRSYRTFNQSNASWARELNGYLNRRSAIEDFAGAVKVGGIEVEDWRAFGTTPQTVLRAPRAKF